MTDLEKLQKENKHLKDLLEQVYDTSFLDDMINEGCLERKDDEMLGYNLFLKSEIKEALNLSTEVKDVANKVRQDLKSEDVARKNIFKFNYKQKKKPN